MLRRLLHRLRDDRRPGVWVRRYIGDLCSCKCEEEKEECADELAYHGDDVSAHRLRKRVKGLLYQARCCRSGFAVVVMAGGFGEHFGGC